MIEIELIQRAQVGEPSAIRDLYKLYAPRVYAIVRRLAADDALAEDWAQEAWVRIFRALGTFRGEARFSTWLHRIAVNSALHGKRWRDRRTMRETALEDTVPVRATSEDALLRMKLERAMKQLPERMRQVLVLHDIEGFTHEEIAEFLGVTAGTSKSQLFKARARMRELLRPVTDLRNSSGSGSSPRPIPVPVPGFGEDVCLT